MWLLFFCLLSFPREILSQNRRVNSGANTFTWVTIAASSAWDYSVWTSASVGRGYPSTREKASNSRRGNERCWVTPWADQEVQYISQPWLCPGSTTGKFISSANPRVTIASSCTLGDACRSSVWTSRICFGRVACTGTPTAKSAWISLWNSPVLSGCPYQN